MQVITIQGIVKNGQIHLSEDVKLPEMTKVYVVIPPPETGKKIMSPRLANKADAQRFVKKIEADVDDEIR
jgi:hypothetical protein